MVQAIQANQITLGEADQKLDLHLELSPDFFPEWQGSSGLLSDYEKKTLDIAKDSFLYVVRNAKQEALVKMIVVSPLLSAAGFYQEPFSIGAEQATEIAVEDEGDIIRGKIDVLVIKENMWVVVIETKGAGVSLQMGIPQALTYMASNPDQTLLYGMVTNGAETIFIKLDRETGQYGFSKTYSILNPGNDFYEVASILKSLGSL